MCVLENCDFILGENNSIIIVVPTELPKDAPLTCEVHKFGLVFKSGEDFIGNVTCHRRDILQRFIGKAKVGFIEFVQGAPQFPAYITSVANIEVMAA